MDNFLFLNQVGLKCNVEKDMWTQIVCSKSMDTCRQDRKIIIKIMFLIEKFVE